MSTECSICEGDTREGCDCHAPAAAPREPRGDNHGEDWDASPDPKPVAREQETTPQGLVAGDVAYYEQVIRERNAVISRLTESLERAEALALTEAKARQKEIGLNYTLRSELEEARKDAARWQFVKPHLSTESDIDGDDGYGKWFSFIMLDGSIQVPPAIAYLSAEEAIDAALVQAAREGR